MEVGGGDEAPADRVPRPGPEDPPEGLLHDAEPSDDPPRPPAHGFKEVDERRLVIGQSRIGDRLALEVAQPQVRRESARREIVPKRFRSRNRRDHAEISRHRHERMACDGLNLAAHVGGGLMARIEEIAVRDADAERLDEGDVLDDVVAAEVLRLVLPAQQFAVERTRVR